MEPAACFPRQCASVCGDLSMVLKQQAPAIKAAQDDFFRAQRQMPLENEGLSFDVTSNYRGKEFQIDF